MRRVSLSESFFRHPSRMVCAGEPLEGCEDLQVEGWKYQDNKNKKITSLQGFMAVMDMASRTWKEFLFYHLWMKQYYCSRLIDLSLREHF